MHLTDSQHEEIIELCQALVREKSHSGQEQGAVKVLQKYWLDNGFDEIAIDEYGSIVGCIKGTSTGCKLLFEGHLDVVPASDERLWQYKPYAATRANGRIYGRGTTDMKGAVAAMSCAASFFAKHYGRDFAGEIHLVGGVHEECFEGVAARVTSRQRQVQPDLVIIGEPSELQLVIGQKGRAEIVLETFGEPAHSSMPEKGINAVHSMMCLIEKVEQIPVPEDAELGKGVAALTDIISTPYPGASVVPSHCKVTYDRRLLVGETQASVLAPYQAVIDELSKLDQRFKAKVSYSHGEDDCYTGKKIACSRFFPAWCATANDDYVKKVQTALNKNGLNSVPTYYPFCTNGSHYAGEAHIPTIGWGPSQGALAHTIDEYIEEEQLIKATLGYISILEEFLTK